MHFVMKRAWVLPIAVWALSLSTFLLNLSSVMVFVCMPVFLTTYFGLSYTKTGALEGIVEGFSLLVRAIAGMLSDVSKRRKTFLMWGYVLSFVSRILLAVVGMIQWVMVARFVDKLGNGIQASPREAYISDVTPAPLLGKAYGLNKTLGILGSLIGSVMLVGVFSYWKIDMYSLFYCSAALVGLSIVLLAWGVREAAVPTLPDETSISFRQRFQGILRDTKSFSGSYWLAIVVIFLFKLGYFSGTFLILWVDQQHFKAFLGIPVINKPDVVSALVMTLQNGVCALLSYPMGALSDKIDRRWVVALGLGCMLGSMLCFGLGTHSLILITLGVVLYGIQMSMQGALLALLSSTMPVELRGTGFGLFFLISGVGVIIANQLFMKQLWETYSPEAAFLTICIPIIAALFLLRWLSPSQAKAGK